MGSSVACSIEVLPNNSTDVEIQVEQSVADVHVPLVRSTVTPHIGNNVTRNIKPSVEFMTASRHAEGSDDVRHFQELRCSDCAYQRWRWHHQRMERFRSTLDRVWLGDIMPIITKSMDESTSRIQNVRYGYRRKVSESGPTVGRLGQPLEDDAYTTILVKECVGDVHSGVLRIENVSRTRMEEAERALQMPVSEPHSRLRLQPVLRL
jgi:hypothetical protein